MSLRALVIISAIVAAALASAAQAAPPTATTGQPPAVNLGCTPGQPVTVTFTGTVNPSGKDTTWYFEYGTATQYVGQTTTQDAGSGTADVPVSASISVTTVPQHVRLVADNADGPVHGMDQTVPVVVPPCPAPAPPQVTTSVGTPKLVAGIVCLGQTPVWTATATVTVTPAAYGASVNGLARIEYGNTSSYGRTSDNASVFFSGATAPPVTFTEPLRWDGTTVHYAVVITTAGGGVLGPTPDQSLTVPTPACDARKASLRWTLHRLSGDHRHATIIISEPCGAYHQRITVKRGRHGTLVLTVTAEIPGHPPCSGIGLFENTVKLPRAVSRTQLRHGKTTS